MISMNLAAAIDDRALRRRISESVRTVSAEWAIGAMLIPNARAS
jgi:hypothetical protein